MLCSLEGIEHCRGREMGWTSQALCPRMSTIGRRALPFLGNVKGPGVVGFFSALESDRFDSRAMWKTQGGWVLWPAFTISSPYPLVCPTLEDCAPHPSTCYHQLCGVKCIPFLPSHQHCSQSKLQILRGVPRTFGTNLKQRWLILDATIYIYIERFLDCSSSLTKIRNILGFIKLCNSTDIRILYGNNAFTLVWFHWCTQLISNKALEWVCLVFL